MISESDITRIVDHVFSTFDKNAENYVTLEEVSLFLSHNNPSLDTSIIFLDHEFEKSHRFSKEQLINLMKPFIGTNMFSKPRATPPSDIDIITSISDKLTDEDYLIDHNVKEKLDNYSINFFRVWDKNSEDFISLDKLNNNSDSVNTSKEVTSLLHLFNKNQELKMTKPQFEVFLLLNRIEV